MNIIHKPVALGNFTVGRHGHVPIAIVIHIQDGTQPGTDAWFNNSAAKVSAHYAVAKDGTISQYVSDKDTAYANGTLDRPSWPVIAPGGQFAGMNPNPFTLSIEHEGKDGDTLTGEQASSSEWLIEKLCSTWGIPLDEAHVIPHHAIRFDKTCPGSGISCSALVTGALCVRALKTTPPALIAQQSAPEIPQNQV